MKNITINPKKEKFNVFFILKKSYHALYFSEPIIIFLIGLSVYFFPKYFSWVYYPKLVLLFCFLAIIFQICGFLINKYYPNKYFWLTQCLVWVFLIMAFALTTGGIDSPMLFVVTITLIATANRLNYKEVAIVGTVIIFSIITLALLKFNMLTDPSYITNNLLRITIYILFVYFVYSLVKETLSQKYQKEEAQRKFIELSEFNQVKETFLTVTSHQLRTPLTGVKWTLENLFADKNISDENKKIIKTSMEKIDNSIDIIGEMLKAVESNTTKLKSMEIKNVDIKDLINKIIENLSFFVEEKGVLLKINDEGINGAQTKADPETLRFAISNVVDNAIRYSPKGKVIVNLKKEDNFIKISVKDNGIGISEVDQQFIFGKFYRAKNAILIDPNETGVGLYSTKRVIEFYNGTINLESNIGEGTTVTIRLPII